MQNQKITKIALIPAVSLVFALSPFSKAHSSLIGEQWEQTYYTPTNSGLIPVSSTKGEFFDDKQMKLNYCIGERRYEADVAFKRFVIPATGNVVVNLDSYLYVTLANGQLVQVAKFKRDDGSLSDVKISPDDVKAIGASLNIEPLADGVTRLSENCTLQHYEKTPDILPYAEELYVEDCPAGQTINGEMNGLTQKIGYIPSYFRNDASQQKFFKFASDDTYSQYDADTYKKTEIWGRSAINENGLVKTYGGYWLEGYEEACKTPSVEPEPIEHLQETRNIDCEAGESGYISQYRTYEMVNGNRQNESEWITNFNSCTKIAEPDYSVPLHFDHDQYIYEDCPAGQTVGGFDGGSIQRQGRVEIWSETNKNGEIKYSIKNLGNGAFTPINLDDYRTSEPPFFKMPSSFMYDFNGIWTPGFESVCKVPVTYTYEYQTRNTDCAAGQIGQITEQRMIRKGSDSSEFTMIDWYTVMNSCQTPPPPKPEPQPEPQPEPEPVLQDVTANVFVSCPEGQTVGSKPNGETVRKGTIPLVYNGSSYAIEYYGYYIPIPVSKAADGSVFIDDFTEADVDDFGGVWSKGSEEACGVPVAFQQLTDWKTETVACQEGQAGHIKYDYNRTWEYDALNDVIRNDSGWISSVKENTCKTLEDALLEEEEVTKTEQCPSGQFGSITVKGKNVTYGLSGTKFIETDRVNNCVAELDQFSQETRERECPDGQIGSISEYRITATNNEGAESYPYGNSWLQASNTCANQVSADEELSNADNRPKGLLSNQTIKASDDSSLDKLLNYLNVVQDVNLSADYRLYLLIDRLDNLNSGKIEAVASKWKKVSGGIVILSDAPRFARSYIGFGGITKSNVDDFVVVSADYQNGNIKVVAKEIKSISSGKPIVFNVPFAEI
ncbi:hypothetical protein LLW09_07640 [Pseudomonas paracarnis]|uniref:Uncharacterized protein n=1 Tax=Pseudomonas paracarnis TaxID=2750625 RepID=A0ABU6BRJ1_9PSED|nr:hypothetical protein [Pseudomonas paracarnis]MEB3782426.1 hypothetical protein [Pseudomonas paracarnis]